MYHYISVACTRGRRGAAVKQMYSSVEIHEGEERKEVALLPLPCLLPLARSILPILQAEESRKKKKEGLCRKKS